MTRREAIESGVANAVDTVIVDKAMLADQAYEWLENFAGDALAGWGHDDRLRPAELSYARSLWPL
jgi:hypothetical protein